MVRLGQTEATVRRMAAAHAAGRIDEMLATMHAEVEWEPWSRPGLSFYVGHDGIRKMLADVQTTLGAHTVVLDGIIEAEPDRLIASARIIRHDPLTEARLEMRIEMRDGLIYRVVTGLLA